MTPARRSFIYIMLFVVAVAAAIAVIGRTIIAPFEVPVSLVLGVLGAAVFIFLLLRQRRRV